MIRLERVPWTTGPTSKMSLSEIPLVVFEDALKTTLNLVVELFSFNIP